MHHTITPIETLTIHDINAMAKHAVDRGDSLEQANVYEGHIGAAYNIYAQEVVA